MSSIRSTLYHRGGDFLGAARLHPVLGRGVQTLTVPVYAVDGDGSALTREELLLDPLCYPGTYLRPPAGLLLASYSQEARMRVAVGTREIDVAAVLAGESHFTSGTDADPDTAVTPDPPAAARSRHYAVGALRTAASAVSDRASMAAALISGAPVFAGSPQAAGRHGVEIGGSYNGGAQGGAEVNYRQVGFSLLTPGELTYHEFPTEIYYPPEAEEPYVLQYSSIDLDFAFALMGIYTGLSAPIYLDYYGVWFPPIAMQAIRSGGTALTVIEDASYEAMMGDPAYADDLAAAVADLMTGDTSFTELGIPDGISRYLSAPPDPEVAATYGDPIDWDFGPASMLPRSSPWFS